MLEGFENDKIVRGVYSLLLAVNMSVSHKRKNVIVQKKALADFVTDIDFSVEQFLMSGLRLIEDIPCLTEESNKHVYCNSYWVIDPIDGTTNLIHGYPSYCVSIAKVRNNETEYGFVYNLASKELFFSKKGCGSYLLNTRSSVQKEIHVSDVCDMGDSLIGLGYPYDKTKTESLFRIANSILKECHDIKRNGPASLDICYVACGRLDAYFEYDLKEWDYRAGKLILEEAGGIITNWYGGAITGGTVNVVVSNGEIHRLVLKHLELGAEVCIRV